jgi:nucleotide-binding universal stress UspA family protein
VRIAEAVKADSIAMGMQGSGGEGGLVLGPVTLRVVRLTKLSVLLAK